MKIHYASLGSGPLVVMIHGFPDFWYSWRHQMAALADRYQVVAIDQRGYNLSDKPKGVENYDTRPAGRRRRRRDPSPRPGSRDHRRPRLGRRGGVDVRDAPAADDRAVDHPQPAAPDRARYGSSATTRRRSRTANTPGTSSRSRRRPDSVLRQADDAAVALGLGRRSGGAQAVRGGLRALGLRGDAELLQAQLPAGRGRGCAGTARTAEGHRCPS